MLKFNKTKARGFTLVEIIVVMAIIAVLAAVIGIAMAGYLKDSRESRASADARNIGVCVQGLIYSPYYGKEVKTAIAASSSSGSCVFSYDGSGVSGQPAAVAEILKDVGNDYKFGFVVYVTATDTSSPEIDAVYVYSADSTLATQQDRSIRPDGTYPADIMDQWN